MHWQVLILYYCSIWQLRYCVSKEELKSNKMNVYYYYSMKINAFLTVVGYLQQLHLCVVARKL